MSSQLGKKLIAYIGTFMSVVIVSIALWVMYRTLHSIRLSDVIASLEQLSFSSILFGFGITALSYLTVTGYDVVALNHIKHRVPYSRAALSAFLASTFGNNIGFAILTGTSIRYRIYSHAGLSALDVAGVSSMCALTTVLGMSVVFAMSTVLQSGDVTNTGIPIPIGLLQAAGVLLLLAISGYVIISAYNPLTLRTANWSLSLPSAKTTLLQILLATTNLSLVATLIYVLLPEETSTSYITFLSVFALAVIAGSASNVPGGIGVFESVILVGLPEIPPAALLGSILLFRCIYYLSPLGIAATLLIYHEASRQRKQIEELHESVLDVLDEIGPHVMAIIIMLAGVILLFSGSIPIGFDRNLSPVWVPLFLVEISHLTGAAAGIGLLLLARGISRRLASSFDLAVNLLIIGIATSLLKGFGYREAIVLGLILALLWLTRPEFHRKASLFDEGLPAEWVSLLSIILAVTIWLGLFSFKGIPYSPSLWWTFSYDNDYSRFLRSLLVVFGICGAATYINLLRPDPVPGLPESVILQKIRRILASESSLGANLVLLGDKRILFNPSETAFIMYQIQSKSWVVLGDPVGPKDQHRDLIWSFRGLCDRYGAWPVFYMVDESELPFFNELELSIERMGDEAVLPLENFSLEGPLRTELVSVHTRVKKLGARLEILEGDELDRIMPELQSVSDNWLKVKEIDEMGFSRGFFDKYYVRNFPCALIRINNRIIAFAIIWTTPNREEIGLDLMRYHEDAPKPVMDFLIIETMLWGKKMQYRRFSLGIAPLPGLKNHPLAPLWHRVGVLMYRSGSTTDTIDEIRPDEEKYNPVWRPKYIIAPSGIRTPRIIRDISRLISQRNVHVRAE
ncbi:MAG: bifunctional lysylphosphatidylglycerol flippase/synthetase MprF [Methylococcaceae bacterium]|nr:bifunctional lysylphosphatidylglycerol flippase/synthetase MprF [Methylococcaceae bacterium]MCI0734374.1 bifunctional lysylphosphatidylglycerol flippase/synthetase MprF [Methylococcaceae bacterium]